MFLTMSLFDVEQYGEAYYQFRKRLGLESIDSKLGFLRQTVISPFQVTKLSVPTMSSVFRNAVMNSIGGVCHYYPKFFLLPCL